MKQYAPGTAAPRSDVSLLAEWVENELRIISAATYFKDYVQLLELHSAPNKLVEGMIVLADGSDWNPGSGAGFYGYRGGSWRKLD